MLHDKDETITARPESGSQGQVHWKPVITWISVGILVGTEVFGMALAAAWAISGLFEFPPALTYTAYALFFALASYAMYAFMRYAAKVEPLRD